MSLSPDNINSIKEIYPGQFYMILDFATNKFLEHILDDNYKYVWVSNHFVAETNDYQEGYDWRQYKLPLFDNNSYYNILARKITFEFAMPTSEFREVLPKLPPGITLVQLNQLPKHYLQLDRIERKTRYELLIKECDYLFEIYLPSSTDYGELVSPNKEWLQSVLDDKNIDWNDLP
jgi:hypothetical protein